MDQESTLRALLDLTESLGIEVRRAPGSGAGWDFEGASLIRLGDREILFLDIGAPRGAQIAAVAAGLAGRDEIEQMFLPPEIREIIDRLDDRTSGPMR